MVEPRYAVRVRDDAHARIAWALASHPGIGKVGMLGRKPPTSWRDLVVPMAQLGTADIVVDPEPDDEGIVVTAGPSNRAGITHASPEGLARSLTVRLGGVDTTPIWTTKGRPRRDGAMFHFPPPIGLVRGEPGDAPIESDLAGAGAFGSGSLVVVDDRRFLETVCIAAAAVVVDIAITRPTPVWERAEGYLAACEELGLVIAAGVNS